MRKFSVAACLSCTMPGYLVIAPYIILYLFILYFVTDLVTSLHDKMHCMIIFTPLVF